MDFQLSQGKNTFVGSTNSRNAYRGCSTLSDSRSMHFKENHNKE